MVCFLEFLFVFRLFLDVGNRLILFFGFQTYCAMSAYFFSSMNAGAYGRRCRGIIPQSACSLPPFFSFLWTVKGFTSQVLNQHSFPLLIADQTLFIPLNYFYRAWCNICLLYFCQYLHLTSGNIYRIGFFYYRGVCRYQEWAFRAKPLARRWSTRIQIG